jgi:bacteriocin-like protein
VSQHKQNGEGIMTNAASLNERELTEDELNQIVGGDLGGPALAAAVAWYESHSTTWVNGLPTTNCQTPCMPR